jgi:hypothetical protein
MSDMSIFKNFTITERVKAQFQASFFNVFNHPSMRFRATLALTARVPASLPAWRPTA